MMLITAHTHKICSIDVVNLHVPDKKLQIVPDIRK